MPPKPKKKCCVSQPRCKRCPIRLMAEGKLPDGYGVKKRRLVQLGVDGKPLKLAKKSKKSKKSKKLPAAA